MVLVFNTARPKKMIPGAFYEAFGEEYWVFSNGTTCLKAGETVFHTCMERRHVHPILHSLHRKHPSYFFSVEAHGQIYTTSSCDTTNRKYYAQSTVIDFMESQEINKIIIIAENRDFPVGEIKHLLHPQLKLLVTEKGKYVQIMPQQVSKLTAVEAILSSLHLDLSNVLSFGDDLNDLELIRASGIGVAMDNADPILRNAAGFVTASNDENGVAVFIGSFLLPAAAVSLSSSPSPDNC